MYPHEPWEEEEEPELLYCEHCGVCLGRDSATGLFPCCEGCAIKQQLELSLCVVPADQLPSESTLHSVHAQLARLCRESRRFTCVEMTNDECDSDDRSE